MIISKPELASFLNAANGRPHDFLGMHVCKKGRATGLVVRAFIREAKSCEVVTVPPEKSRVKPKSFPMEQLAPEGFFEVFIPRKKEEA